MSRTWGVCLHIMHVLSSQCVCGGRQRDVRMCEWEEEGKVRQGHKKGRGTQDGETEEEIERKKGKNKRWKRGWKDVGWGWGNWVKAKTGSHLCQLGWRDSAHSLSRAGTFHCSLTVLPETPHLRTQWEVNQWLSGWIQRGEALAACAWMRFMMSCHDSQFFLMGGVHTHSQKHQMSIRTCSALLLFCWWWGSKMPHNILLFKCFTINELISTKYQLSLK